MKNPEQIPQFMRLFLDKKLRVGFSGGADSTALIVLLLKWGFAPEQLEAVHFDHGLRGEASRLDALWCRSFCGKLKIKFTLVELDLQERIRQKGSVEDIARNARWEWYIKNDDASPVVLAHHKDDCREDLLLKLARGGNSGALSSMREMRGLHGLTVLRPLLEWSKQELEDLLKDADIGDWRIDQTNSSTDYHRNFLRNVLLKQWGEYHPAVLDGLERSRKALQMDADFIRQCAGNVLRSLGEVTPQKTTVDFWKKLHPALLVRVLHTYLVQVSGQESLQLNHRLIEHFQAALQLDPSGEKRYIELGQNCNFILQNDTLQFVQECVALPENIQWHWRNDPVITWGRWQLKAFLPEQQGAFDDRAGCFFFAAAAVPEVLYISSRQGGEKMTVWGSDKPRRVKHLLADSECSCKEDLPILHDAGGNIYLLGNLRRSSLAPVEPDDKNILAVEVVCKAE